MKPVAGGAAADVVVALFSGFAEAVLLLRDVRTRTLSCCLVVDLGRPVGLLSATLSGLANRSPNL